MKIITALDNIEIAEALSNEENIDLICMDISYKEGIIEQLDQNKKADLLIFDEKIDGQIPTNDLIRQIKERARTIEIIIVSQNKEETKRQIGRFKKIQIYETNKIKIKNLLQLIFSSNMQQTNDVQQSKDVLQSKDELQTNDLLKPKIKQQSEVQPMIETNKETEQKQQRIIKKVPQIKEIYKDEETSQFEKVIEDEEKPKIEELSQLNSLQNKATISGPTSMQNLATISGSAGSGKTTIAILISKFLAIENNKQKNHLKINHKLNTLLVDFNLPETQDISTIFETNHPNVLTAIDTNIQTIATKKYIKVKMLLKEYDFKSIVVDVGNSTEEAERQKLLCLAKTNIVLVEPSVTGIKHANSLIDYYMKLGINPKNIKIVINKQDKASVDISIIKNLINKKIIGEIKYSPSYNALINNGFKNINFILNKHEKQEIKKIANKI